MLRSITHFLTIFMIYFHTFIINAFLSFKEVDSEVANPVPLNHNAAHHKIAVRPKRTHGLPRKRVKQVRF